MNKPAIHFGADYYPEQWPEERWPEDARLIAEALQYRPRMMLG